jgi:hypothetical protein
MFVHFCSFLQFVRASLSISQYPSKEKYLEFAKLGCVHGWHIGCLVFFSIATETGGILNPFNHRYHLTRIGYLPCRSVLTPAQANDSSISPMLRCATFRANTFRAVDLSRAH